MNEDSSLWQKKKLNLSQHNIGKFYEFKNGGKKNAMRQHNLLCNNVEGNTLSLSSLSHHLRTIVMDYDRYDETFRRNTVTLAGIRFPAHPKVTGKRDSR